MPKSPYPRYGATFACLVSTGWFLYVSLDSAMHDGRRPGKDAWMVPGVTAGCFFAYTAFTMVKEGPMAFWPEHIRNMWGNQIFFDLMLSLMVGFTALAKDAYTLGMPLLPWAASTFCLGSLGLLTFQARILYLMARNGGEN